MLFHGICLITEDVPWLVAFYSRLLDAPFAGDAVHAEATSGRAYLAIYARQAANTDMHFGLGPVHGTGNVTLMFQVDDVDATYDRLRAWVTTFITTPHTYPWGTRSVHLTDPDGNLVTLFCPAG